MAGNRAHEEERRHALVAAEARATRLLDAIEASRLIAAGRTEREVEVDIFVLAESEFGVERHWHKRIVRSGPNTLTIANDNPPIRRIDADDTVYVDLGPVFGEWEADIGRSYALGSDEAKTKLVADLPNVFASVQERYHMTPDITGVDLYAYAQRAAEDSGWAFGGVIAGHVIAEFPHMRLPGDKDLNRISPRNPTRMNSPDGNGRQKHWILEIHLVDHARTFGGFYERLL
jgi:Xaa-Pro dipeptidase